MRVMWNSDKVDKPYVSYSLYPDLRNAAMVSANSRTYGASDLCGARANISNSVMFIDPGYLHDTVLTGTHIILCCVLSFPITKLYSGNPIIISLKCLFTYY